MKRFIFMIVAMFALMMPTYAQQTTVEGSRFFDNTYVGVGVGGQVGLTDMVGHDNWTIAPTASLYFGKWFTPVVGVELNGDVLFHDGFTTRSKVVDASYVGFNARLNLNNLIHRYTGTPDRVEVIPFAGLGWLHGYGHTVIREGGNVPTFAAVDNNAMGVKMGIDLAINVGKTRAWAVNVRPNVVYALTGRNTAHVNPVYDVRYGRLGLDVGFTYKLGHKNSKGERTHNFVRAYTVAEYDAMVAELSNVKPDTVEVVREVEVVKEVVVEKSAPAAEPVYVFSTPYFKQGGYTLDLSGDKMLAVVANEIVNGDKDARYVITGYASVEGEEDFNKSLSLKRANVVRDALVKRGVNPDVLTVVAGGATEQFGAELDENRTVVINQAE